MKNNLILTNIKFIYMYTLLRRDEKKVTRMFKQNSKQLDNVFRSDRNVYLTYICSWRIEKSNMSRTKYTQLIN